MIPPPPEVPKVPAPVPTGRELAVRSGLLARQALDRALVYQPQPLGKPWVHPELLELPWDLGVLEVLRYSLARLEYTMAADGWLRAWLLLGLKILVFFIVPLLVLAVLLLVLGGVMDQVQAITAAILSSAQNLQWAALFVVGFIAIICIAIPLLLAYLCLCWRYRSVQSKLADKKPVAAAGAKPITVTVIDSSSRNIN